MIHKWTVAAAALCVALICGLPSDTQAAGLDAGSAMMKGGSWTLPDNGQKVLVNNAQQRTDLWISNKGPDDILVTIGPPNKTWRIKAGKTFNGTVKLGQSAVIQDGNPGNQQGSTGRYKTSP